MNGILLHLVPASAYLILGYVLCMARRRDQLGQVAMLSRILLVTGLVTHGIVLGQDMLEGDTLHFGLAVALSLTLWLALLIYFFESLLTRIDNLLAMAAIPAACCALLPALMPSSIHLNIGAPLFRLHFVVAMLAYSFFALAALHAIMMAITERRLHHGKLDKGSSIPLLTLERLTFRQIGVSFVFLTLTLVSGLAFPASEIDRPMTVKYKIAFTLAAWFVFGILLAGRHFRGWRGRIAQRWTLAGFVFLLLAYAGTHFVLEILLHRS